MTLWTPAQLGASQLLGWYDPSDSSARVVSGGNITSLLDKSGNGRTATATTTIPLASAAINGLDAAQVSNGAGFQLPQTLYNGINGVNGLSFATVARDDLLSNGFPRLLSLGGPSEYGQDYSINGYLCVQVEPSNDLSPYTNNSAVVESPGVTSAPFFGVTTFDSSAGGGGDTMLSALNGGTAATGSISYPFYYYTQLIYLYGSQNNGGLTGLGGEAVIGTGAWTLDIRQKIEGYLAWKWGEQANLPANHPYANAPPQIPAFTMAGGATTSFIASAWVAATWTSAGGATVTAVGGAKAASSVATLGAGSLSPTGAARATSALASAGTGTFTALSAGGAAATFSIAGAAVTGFQGAARVAANLSPAGTGVFAANGQTFAASVLVAPALGDFVPAGQSRVTSTLAALGGSNTSFVSVGGSAALLSSAGASTALFTASAASISTLATQGSSNVQFSTVALSPAIAAWSGTSQVSLFASASNIGQFGLAGSSFAAPRGQSTAAGALSPIGQGDFQPIAFIPIPRPALSLTEDQIFETLGAFLDTVLPEGVISEKGQINRVPEPNADNFVIMTSQGSTMLATNETSWNTLVDDPLLLSEMQSTELRIQLDVHGTNSSDNVQIIKTLFRSAYACQFFADTELPLAPLYVGDGSKVPFINGENQWEDRWVIIVSLEVKPVVTYAQDFMADLDLTLVEVDTRFLQ